jgi:hypothetical protein
MRTLRLATAAGLALTGYTHADLYLHGYRVIPTIGLSFLLLASTCFALALLELVALAVPQPPAVRLAAGAVAAAALAGFALSRTVGVFGFVERGLQPAPQALLSIAAEAAVLVAVAGSLVVERRRARTNVDQHSS